MSYDNEWTKKFDPREGRLIQKQPQRDVSELYHELLNAVGRVFPGESRHETALRYIREAEKRAGESSPAKSALKRLLAHKAGYADGYADGLCDGCRNPN